ncbi:MAG TPA: phosphoadenylyl-sulfate reductase [Bryobacteraceae bacterium]|nr:phosphoadenylyl-sulfate reductase [Bryobacteraceae bacterium]
MTLDEIRLAAEGLQAEDLIQSVLKHQDKAACLTCSFQAEDMVVLDMIRKVRPGIPVLFLDTGYHFPETYAYRDRMTEVWGLNLVNLQAELTVAEQESKMGRLFETDPGRCCHMRKVVPLRRALEGYQVWLTGLRREQSPTRAGLTEVELQQLDSGAPILKLSPLARWTTKEVWSYLAVHEIESLPLYEQGYTSIGCQPCTAIPADPSNPRSGRWGGVKLECGIHTH